MRRVIALMALVLALEPWPARAHSTEPSRSEVSIATGEVRWVVLARACDVAHALARERDARILAHDPVLAAYARSRLAVFSERGAPADIRSLEASAEGLDLVRIDLRFERPEGGALWLQSRFLADADLEHRDLARVSVEGEPDARGFVFGPAGDTFRVSLRPRPDFRCSLLIYPATCIAGIALCSARFSERKERSHG
ncbi:hypothetical protein HY251_02715 [bacterium]|nr:hypothetical protein [bacterium]